MASDDVSRRDALKVIAIGTVTTLPMGGAAVVAHDHSHRTTEQGAGAPNGATPKFFTAAELAVIAALSDVIIPADDRSPGAKEAGVAAFVDLMVSASSDEVKSLWRDGLRALEEKCQKELSSGFAGAALEQQTAVLTELARSERRPATLLERFFRSAKNLTIDGYYTSEIGIQQELRYKGNAYLKEFKGCTHPEHQAPENRQA